MIKNYPARYISSITDKIYPILLLLVLFSCLLNLDVFVNNSLFNYFAFVFGSCGILIIVLFSKYQSIKNTKRIIITLPFILFLLWMLFVFFEQGESIQYRIYKTTSCFVFIASFIILRKNRIDTFYKIIALIATLEGLWCILQFLDKIPSESLDFDVTGSFANPNVVAMFLALSLPAVLYLCFKAPTIYLKVIQYLMLLIVCIGLLLLECRTAILGGAFSSVLFLTLHFNLFKRFSRKYLFLGILAIVILSIPIGRQLYLHKKDSADGRMLIWRISAQMVLDSPMRGYGTGMFEKEYNLKQAKAIQEEKLSQNELKNASFVLMAYNDYLEQAIEGGIPALILFVAMLLSFLYSPPKKEKNRTTLISPVDSNSSSCYVAYSGIASFAFMAFFNFILNAISVMFLFCVYAGILCANTSSHKKLLDFSIKPQIIRIIFFLLASCSFYVVYSQLNIAKESRQTKLAHDSLENGNIQEAENLLLPLRESQKKSVSFCITYGNLLYAQNKYAESLEQFNCAKKYSSNPELYDMVAKCQFNLKNKEETISNLYQASALSPKTMRYKFGLMQLLFRSNKIKEACKIAQNIILMEPKNPDEQTNKYQNKAQQLLKHCQFGYAN